MNFREIKSKTIESSISSIVGLVIGAIIATLLWLFSDIPSAFFSLLPILPNILLIKLSIGLFLVVLCEAGVIYILRKSSKLQSFFGVLWDKKRNPYCPSCKNHLSNYEMYGRYFGFYCLSCKKEVCLRDDNGAVIQLYMINKYFAEQDIINKSTKPQK